ncbi:hypothetical protein [Haloarchaeobius salinus]|uniref:hypothetical protein n=1 Tax=Haloarchaeobius salinus TaxID=1198298 RepID=UPI00210D3D4B|nr:hypothetical protein [Haloarchaeobius salinus]
MATSRPRRPVAGEPSTVEWYGRLVQRLGGGLAVASLLVAVTSGAALGLAAGPVGASLDRLVTIAAADPATLPTLAAVCHYGLLGVVVGSWFLGLGFILTGFLE